jgi:integrase
MNTQGATMAKVLELPKKRQLDERRAYGTGSLWLRKTKAHAQGVYWVRFYDTNGRQRAMNSHETDENRAWKFLAKQIGKTEAGTLPSFRAQRTTVEDLWKPFATSYKADLLAKVPTDVPASVRQWREEVAERNFRYVEQRWIAHLKNVFGNKRAAMVTTDDLKDYILHRKNQKVGNAVINREPAVLRRIFTLGYKITPPKIDRVPIFPERLPENVRQGFATRTQYEALQENCSHDWLRGALAANYSLGFRKDELLNLLIRQVNFEEGTISLYRGATKNGESRHVFMPEQVRSLLAQCCRGKGPDDFVFTWNGTRRVKDFRRAWTDLTKAAGVPGLHFHDLRRSAVRGMVRAGITERVAMQISGHRTSSVFQRYNITDESDLASAAKLIEGKHKSSTSRVRRRGGKIKHKLSTNGILTKSGNAIKSL